MPGRPDVAAQRADETSLLHQVRRLIALRKQVPALRTGGPVDVLNAGYPLVYVRGGTHLVVINPRREPASFALGWAMAGAPPRLLAPAGKAARTAGQVTIDGSEVRAGGFSYGVFEAS